MKATPAEYDYHQRILALNDPIAFAELAEELYHPLLQDVQRRAGAKADATLVEEAVGEALLAYHDAPEKYDPHRATLRSYLSMTAYRDFQNAQAREQRVTGHQVSLSEPALQEHEIAGSEERVEDDLAVENLWQVIDEAFSDPTERRIVGLIINKVRSPEPYARLLGLNDLPHDQRLRQVQLAKYRIARRLRRKVAQQLHRKGEKAP